MLKSLFEDILKDLGQRRDESETRRLLLTLSSKDKATLIDDLTEVHGLLQRREDEMRKVCRVALEQLTTDAPMLAVQYDMHHLLAELAATREDVDKHLTCSDAIVQRLLMEVARREKEVTERENRVWGWRMAMAGDMENLKVELRDLEKREESMRVRGKDLGHREEVCQGLAEKLTARETEVAMREERQKERMHAYEAPDDVRALRAKIAERSEQLRGEVTKLAASNFVT